MDSVELKSIDIRHLQELKRLGKQTFIEAFAGVNNPEDFKCYLKEAFDVNTLRDELSNPESRFFFLYEEGELCGYSKINTGTAQTELREVEGMEIERIYVLKTHQGRGLGAWMLNRFKGMAREEQKKYLWLGVWEENHDAIRFYKQHGFVTFDKHPYYVGSDRQMDWMMRLDL
jgi:ribosomal protein S18 acetylase RimI-like enzyme